NGVARNPASAGFLFAQRPRCPRKNNIDRNRIKRGIDHMARVAIVTGGTRGIGRAICEALQTDGMTVVANYAGNDDKARAFTDETGIAAYRWNVGDHAETLAGCAKVAEEVGPIDVLVNNAG